MDKETDGGKSSGGRYGSKGHSFDWTKDNFLRMTRYGQRETNMTRQRYFTGRD